MNTKLNALFVEDRESDVQLIVHHLKEAGFELAFERVENGRQMSDALTRQNWDIIFSDYLMPKFSGSDALKVLQRTKLDIPFVIVSGSIGEETAVEAMKQGASDYVMKDNLLRLVPVVRRELNEKKVRDERRETEKKLREIEWLLSKKPQTSEYVPPYGNLVKLNTSGLILNSVGKETLDAIVSDYLDILETSSAVYEKNGDYATGIFSSGWCQFMDAASRKLCKTDDNKEALSGGKWGCHESCWSEASKKSIETGGPVDIECFGGIRLFAVPIMVRGEAVGSINFGYGNPPFEEEKLEEIGRKINVNSEELRKIALNYNPRPLFIVELAKKRLLASARLIGEIIERKLAEGELKRKMREMEQANEMMLDREDRILELKKEVKALKEKS